MTRRGLVVDFEEPQFSKWLFGSSTTAWLWLVARLWLGWEWLQAGWGKVFGGNLTLRIWDWGKAEYSLTGNANIGWVVPGSPAAAAGLRPEDLILDVDGVAIESARDLQRLMAAERIGKPVPVRVFREGRVQDLVATPRELQG